MLSSRYENDGVSFRKLTDEQEKIKNEIKKDIDAGVYPFVKNICLCGSVNRMLLAEKDCFGLPQKVFLCKKCSLIYQDPILSEKALLDLYEEKFRKLYGTHYVKEEYFENQRKAGLRIAKTMSKYMDLKGKNILDIGCGAGGVLYPLHEEGANVVGIDVDDEYLALGRGKGMDLKKIDFMNFNVDKKFDLIIMTDVFEHLPGACRMLDRIHDYLSDNGYLFIGVPNIAPCIPKFHFLFHLHILHMWYFDSRTLSDLLSSRGFEVVNVCTDRNLEVLSKRTEKLSEYGRVSRGRWAIVKYLFLKFRCTREALVYGLRKSLAKAGIKI